MNAKMIAEEVKEKINELVSDLACCSSYTCRCCEAGEVLRAIQEYARSEAEKCPE